MSDHSDLVARLRNAAESSEQFLDGRAALLYDAADALDVKPGANARLIEQLRSLGIECCDRAAAVLSRLEAADSRARVLPDEEIVAKAMAYTTTAPSVFIFAAMWARSVLTGGKADDK